MVEVRAGYPNPTLRGDFGEGAEETKGLSMLLV